ncbi:unnamed protein product, partial [Prunus brigantina]
MTTVPVNTNVQQTLELLTQALTRTGPPRDPSLGYAEQAKRIGATDFDGDGDPAMAEEWIEKIERVMEIMRVPQDQRVALATFFLTRNARHWWESIKRRYQDPAAITWQVFRAAFDGQYYPLAYQNLKMEEFLQLEQGVMTVLDTGGQMRSTSSERFVPSVLCVASIILGLACRALRYVISVGNRDILKGIAR